MYNVTFLTGLLVRCTLWKLFYASLDVLYNIRLVSYDGFTLSVSVANALSSNSFHSSYNFPDTMFHNITCFCTLFIGIHQTSNLISFNFGTKNLLFPPFFVTYIHNWPLQPFSQDYWPSFSVESMFRIPMISECAI